MHLLTISVIRFILRQRERNGSPKMMGRPKWIRSGVRESIECNRIPQR